MKNVFTVLAAFCCFLSTQAQLQKIKVLELKEISAASVDRLGNFYFVLPSGTMQKYDPDGILMDESSPILLPLALIEPWNPLKVFTYSAQTRHYKYWDHHLALLEDKLLEPSLSINPILVCPANENNKAWVIDAADFSLKRVDLINHKIEVDVVLPADWVNENTNLVFVREYQNRIFILDKDQGIHMLSKLGIPITTIDVKGLNFFNFLGEELCYKKGNDIYLLDLFTGATRKVASLTEEESVQATIITDERIVVVTNENIQFYYFKDSVNSKN